jgi:hypothetical protein
MGYVIFFVANKNNVIFCVNYLLTLQYLRGLFFRECRLCASPPICGENAKKGKRHKKGKERKKWEKIELFILYTIYIKNIIILLIF